jgi:hypothetical protein
LNNVIAIKGAGHAMDRKEGFIQGVGIVEVIVYF